jgi:RNA polymerase sigma factor for flagellar operon FliA
MLTDRERKLAERAVPLVQKLARSVGRRVRGASVDDLVSVGSVAGVEAARTFDDSRGVPFEGFAYKRIRGAMLREGLKEATGSMHYAITRALRADDPDFLPPSELSLDQALEDTPEKARTRCVAWLKRQAAEQVIGSLMASPEKATTASEELHKEQLSLRLLTAIAELDEQERYFVRRFYADDATLETIAGELGVVIRTVTRIHDRVKTKLGKRLRRESD